MKQDFIDALYSLDNTKHDKILEELKHLVSIYKKTSMLQSRFIPTYILEEFIVNIKQYKDIIQCFIRILHEKKLMPLLPDIVRGYEKQLLAQKGIYDLYITSKAVLKKEEVNEIVDFIEKRTKFKFIVHLNTDTTIISGCILQYKDLYINLSGGYILNNLQEYMLSKL